MTEASATWTDATLEPWAELWYRDMSAAFGAPVSIDKRAGLVPENIVELDTLLACFLMDKAVYELGYELNNRPEWVSIPIRGIRYLLQTPDKIRKGSEKES